MSTVEWAPGDRKHKASGSLEVLSSVLEGSEDVFESQTEEELFAVDEDSDE
jgi:hypothetical protein